MHGSPNDWIRRIDKNGVGDSRVKLDLPRKGDKGGIEEGCHCLTDIVGDVSNLHHGAVAIFGSAVRVAGLHLQKLASSRGMINKRN